MYLNICLKFRMSVKPLATAAAVVEKVSFTLFAVSRASASGYGRLVIKQVPDD
jgi:hypothetical protein